MIVNCAIEKNIIKWCNENGKEYTVTVTEPNLMLFNEKQILCIFNNYKTVCAFDEEGNCCELKNNDNFCIGYLQKFPNYLTVVASVKYEDGLWHDYNFICDGKKFIKNTPAR